MSKYDDFGLGTRAVNPNDITTVLAPGENVIWQGKPKKSAFIFNKLATMFPIVLVWLIIDGGFIAAIFASGEIGQMLWFVIPFFALHLMPVWIWIGNAVTANKRWQNTSYAVTDRRILIQSGFVGIDYTTIYYKEIQNVRLSVGFIDKLLKVGDIHFELAGRGYYSRESKNAPACSFLDIEDPYSIYPYIQKIVMDIQTDMHYPNDLRPEENHGYNTTYKGF